MKKISKQKLDELIVLTRQFWEGDSDENWEVRYELAKRVETESGLSPFAIIDLLDGILSPRGFEPDAENDEIYSFLRILGWEATDEVQEIESL